MSNTTDQIIEAALKLSEVDRLVIAARLLDTLPDDQEDAADDDNALIAELERRAAENDLSIPVSELWKQD